MGYWTTDNDGNPAFVDDQGRVSFPGQLRPYAKPDQVQAPAAAPQPPAAPAPAAEEAPGDADAGPEADEQGAIPPGASVKNGTSVSAYNPKKVEKAKKGQASYEQQANESAMSDFQNLLAPEAANAQTQQGLVQQEGEISARQAEDQRQQNLYAAELQRKYGAEEQAAQAVADSQIQKSHQAYLAQVQAYSAMNVDPGKLWKTMGSGGRVQALASVFVSDFLGARGIHTSAMDTLNQAIDRDISAQVANINKQGQVTDHFRALYDMTTAESASDLEARTRIRGFYLASADKEMQAELGKYDAPLARVKAQEASAAIQDEYYKQVVVPLYKITTDRVNDAVRTHMSQTVAEIQAAAEKYSADQELRGKQAEAGGKQGAPSPYLDYNGNAIGWIRPDVAKNPALVSKLEEKTRNLKNLAVMVHDLKAMIKQYGGTYGGPGQDWINQLKPEDARRIEQKASAVAYQAALAIHGPRMAKDMVDQFKQQYPIEQWSTNGGVQGVLSDRVIEANNDYAATLAQNVYAPSGPDEQAQLAGYKGVQTSLGPEATEAKVDLSHPFDDDAADPVARAVSQAQEPNSDHDAGLAHVAHVAEQDAVVDKSPDPMQSAVDMMEDIKAKRTAGFDPEKTQLTLDQLVIHYHSQTGEWPKGRTGDLYRADEKKNPDKYKRDIPATLPTSGGRTASTDFVDPNDPNVDLSGNDPLVTPHDDGDGTEPDDAEDGN